MSSSRAKGLMYELKKKKIGTVLTSKSVGTGPSSYEKRIYRAAVSQRLRNTTLQCPVTVHYRMTKTSHNCNSDRQGKMSYSFLAPELGWDDLDVQSLLVEDDGAAARGARNSMIFCNVILRNWGCSDACNLWFVRL